MKYYIKWKLFYILIQKKIAREIYIDLKVFIKQKIYQIKD